LIGYSCVLSLLETNLQLVTVTIFSSLCQTTVADSIDLYVLDLQQHGHVPYPISIAAQGIITSQAYRFKKNNQLPIYFCHQGRFQNKLGNRKAWLSRDLEKELNFQKVISNSYLAYSERDLILPDNNLEETSKLACL
jgi:hypothetical protein